MKKRILCVLTIGFYAVMVLATFFHQNIDGLFREKVQLVQMEAFYEESPESIELNGVQTEVIKREEFLLLPKQAVQDGKVYVVETVQVPYGSYEVVRLKEVTLAGNLEDKIKIARGLNGTEKVVAVFDDALQDGMRVVVCEKKP